MSKPKMFVSFSGGRTSAFMTKRLMDEKADEYNFIVLFANTGLEHPKTLEFVHNCDLVFGFNTVWVESVTHPGERKSSTHKVVTYETASRKGEPFEESIKKYGIPNLKFPSCTRELKLRPMRSYLRTIGIDPMGIPTAIGIRADEMRRVKKGPDARMIVYPLVDWWPTDKTDVLDWWEDQPFDLGIDEFEGNCKGCFKKSMRKHFLQIERDPTVFDWHRRMEDLYRNVGPQSGRRVFFRGDIDTRALFALYEENKGSHRRFIDIREEANGCTESCEVYEMDIDRPSGVREGEL